MHRGVSLFVVPPDRRDPVGLGYLERTQLPSGEFATYTGPELDLRDAVAYPKSVYVNSFVVHSLGFLPEDPRVPLIRDRAADFLEAEEEASGVWNYEGGRGGWRLPPDLDSTCCAAAALVALGRRSPPAFLRAPLACRAAERGRGGRSLLHLHRRQRSPQRPDQRTLCAGGRFACQRQRALLCRITRHRPCRERRRSCEQLVAAESYTGHSFAEDYRGESRPRVPPHFVLYAITRAYADGRVAALAPAVPLMRDFLTTRLPPPPDEASAFNLACRAVGLLNLGAEPAAVEPYVTLLLEAQGDDGGWPIWGAWAGFPPNYRRLPGADDRARAGSARQVAAAERGRPRSSAGTGGIVTGSLRRRFLAGCRRRDSGRFFHRRAGLA